ncbi:hypothetical protein CDD80_3590 [Ophiocordyceps camponoti-rufipedis]|uniref:Thioredoxin domain-containing protein n=1 Tax=Ophiocordyceps camponoti-rufipedis TaxID=2004952 RepID=A0A2C5ZFR3_9HYPO|nr:hypothetical protein CDD80_3590 [Ophiocordyceps camponoti-rufipedis]
MRVAIPRIFVNHFHPAQATAKRPGAPYSDFVKATAEVPSLQFESDDDFTSLLKSNIIPGVLAFGRLNVDRFGAIANKYGVTVLPSFVFFKHAKQVSINKQAMIRGADHNSLIVACDKFRELAAIHVFRQGQLTPRSEEAAGESLKEKTTGGFEIL